MSDNYDAVALARHLDAIDRRVAEDRPAPDSVARVAQIMAVHEAACAALRRAEVEAELDAVSFDRRAMTS